MFQDLLVVVALGPLLSLNGGPRYPRPTLAYVLHGDEGAAGTESPKGLPALLAKFMK